jgi:hypothetical protein
MSSESKKGSLLERSGYSSSPLSQPSHIDKTSNSSRKQMKTSMATSSASGVDTQPRSSHPVNMNDLSGRGNSQRKY